MHMSSEEKCTDANVVGGGLVGLGKIDSRHCCCWFDVMMVERGKFAVVSRTQRGSQSGLRKENLILNAKKKLYRT